MSRKIPEAAFELLKQEHIQYSLNCEDRSLSRQELMAACQKAEGLLCLLTDTIDADFLAATPNLKGIANMAAGYNNIDLAECTRLKIPVSNTPGVLTEATADLAFGLLLAVGRRLPEAERYLRKNRFRGWSPTLFRGQAVAGTTLGIVGAGRIGTAVAQRARGFNMRILYTSPRKNPDLEKDGFGKRVLLSELLARSDYVSLHVPLTPETRHLIDRKALSLMKTSACLINTSRGPVIDEAALTDALRQKQIAGAGLDVFEEEPRINPGLMDLENVVLLPHIGSATKPARKKMAQMAAQNLIAMLTGKTPPNCLNPEILSP